jgi:predicted O-methyltransferase YrrM
MVLKARLFDLLAAPITYLAALFMRAVRHIGLTKLPITDRIFRHVGIYPIVDHYYEPLFNPRLLRRPLSLPRSLPGIDFNETGQLALLAHFRFGAELARFPNDPLGDIGFYFNNTVFSVGDADCWYSMIRHFKPRRIIEVGCGMSTMLAAAALAKNAAEDPANDYVHICIEPYEASWLASLSGITLWRQRVEEVDPLEFCRLGRNDFLFIDSSHMIRPQGDVLFEILEILPALASGVIVHIHDVFSPRDYRDDWIRKEHKFWNEQYLLEAFLSMNREYEVICALNWLYYSHFEALAAIYGSDPRHQEPLSFYIRRR